MVNSDINSRIEACWENLKSFDVRQDAQKETALRETVFNLINDMIKNIDESGMDEWEKSNLVHSVACFNARWYYATLASLQKALVPEKDRSREYTGYKEKVANENISAKILLDALQP